MNRRDLFKRLAAAAVVAFAATLPIEFGSPAPRWRDVSWTVPLTPALNGPDAEFFLAS